MEELCGGKRPVRRGSTNPVPEIWRIYGIRGPLVPVGKGIKPDDGVKNTGGPTVALGKWKE